LKELRTHHDDNVVEIKQNTGKCLGHEYKVTRFDPFLYNHHIYMIKSDKIVNRKLNSLKTSTQVDEATSSTPRKREYNIPTVGSIEELKTPSFEELLKAFHDCKSPKQMQNGEAKHVSNGRPPLTAIN